MSEEYGPDFVTVTDDEGNEIELEFVDRLEYGGQTYMSFFPVLASEDEDTSGEEYGLIILRVEEEKGGDSFLCTVDDDALAEKVYELFMEQLFEDEEEE